MNRKEKALEFANEAYNINITGRHVQITDSMKDYAMDKISKIERFSNRIIDVNVIMDIQKIEHRVEIIIKVGHLKIRSLAVTNDMYASIDKAVSKIEAQLLRYKNKMQDHHAKHLSSIDMNVNVLSRPNEQEEEFEDNEEVQDNYRPHSISKQETLPLKLLTSDEAVMKMELSGDSFLIFRNEEDRKLKVIYRRDDGNYGIVEPE